MQIFPCWKHGITVSSTMRWGCFSLNVTSFCDDLSFIIYIYFTFTLFARIVVRFSFYGRWLHGADFFSLEKHFCHLTRNKELSHVIKSNVFQKNLALVSVTTWGGFSQ